MRMVTDGPGHNYRVRAPQSPEGERDRERERESEGEGGGVQRGSQLIPSKRLMRGGKEREEEVEVDAVLYVKSWRGENWRKDGGRLLSLKL